MKIRSLKTRISLCIAGLMVIVVGILSGVAYHEFRESLWGSMDLTLQSDLLQIKGLLLSGDPLGAEVQREIQIFLNPKSGMQKIEYQLWFENAADETVETLIASDICETLTAKGVAPPKQDALKLVDLERNQKTFRVLWARYQVPNTPASSPTVLNIALAISSKNAIHEVGEFVRIMVILGCIIVWAAFGLTQQILRWGLRPIDNLADWMSRISEGNLKTVNLEHSAFHRELKPFIKSWEAMLNRLADAMQEQKRFTADAAHELKTPVALIKSTLQLAQSQKRTTDFYETAIANALEDVERLNHLISGLLDLSRLESGESAGRREMIHLKDIIEQVCDAYAAFLSTRELSLTRMLCDADITGNDSQIAQLFGNLIDNAVKYAPPNTEITVSMQINNGTVLTTVHDAGGNIPETECKLLFNRFYRIEKGRDRDSGGSGLGLAIAREIARNFTAAALKLLQTLDGVQAF
jgi:signal transduction histidine kinase